MAVMKTGLTKRVIAHIYEHEKTVRLCLFFSFLVLAFIVGINHEPWQDEAQSWLIARDTSFAGLFRVMGYEGSPALWPVILKVFIMFGMRYKYLFIIPLLFSTIGVWLLIYKSRIPLPFLIILPFTYYIFYQYTAIARSYSLVLPCMQLIVVFYNRRLEKPYIYGLLLILLSGISVHMMLLSGLLFLFYVIDIMRQIQQRGSFRECIRTVLSALLVFASYLFTIYYVKTPSDCSFLASFYFTFESIIVRLGGVFGEAFIYNGTTLYSFLILFIVFAGLVLFYKISIRFCLVSVTIWLFLSTFYYNKWHIGMVFLSIIFALQLFTPVKKLRPVNIEKYRTCFLAVIGILLCFQLYWSARTAVYDCFNAYSGAVAAAEYIKEKGYDKIRIYGMGYGPTAIQPFFDKNIYQNRGISAAYYLWSANNGDMTDEQILNDLPEVLVLTDYQRYMFADIEAALQAEGYKCYVFEGATFVKDMVYESQCYYLYFL